VKLKLAVSHRTQT